MSIFITGATGYIGLRLTHHLAAQGETIHALCYEEHMAAQLQHPNIRIVPGGVLDLDTLRQGMEGCKQVYHLAGYARKWAPDPALFFRINVQGTLNVLQVAREQGVEKLVFTSTASVLGPSPTSEPVHEESIRLLDFFYEYESSKALAENQVLQEVHKGMHIVIACPTRVYGPGLLSESNATTKLIRDYLHGRWRFLPGKGDKTGNYVFVEDVVRGHLLAMQHGRPGEKYILGGENHSYRSFFSILAEVSQKKHRLYGLPLRPVMALAALQSSWAGFLGKEPLAPPYLLRKYTYDWPLSSDKAVRELNYRVTPLEEGFRKTLAWLEEEDL